MEKALEILKELQNISPSLAEIVKVNVFHVPDHYFEEIPNKVLTTVFLHQDEKITDQKVPEGYFDDLSNKILARIRNSNIESAEDEIRAISPILFSIKDKNVFTVPENYFENLKGKIIDKLSDREAKVISISSGRKWWKYAAAAVVAGGITIGSWQIFNNRSTTENGDKVLTTSAKIPDYIKLSFQYKTPEQLENGIASLSNNEIATYLEKHGNIMDDDILANDIDPNELPDTKDYLMNDNTLNNFLNAIDLHDSNKNIQ
ncbi:MAG TPA: hypothetical protein VFI29_22235 [Hanamia sp.]|nr:hypothetical protein [Hanamia sp.]